MNRRDRVKLLVVRIGMILAIPLFLALAMILSPLIGLIHGMHMTGGFIAFVWRDLFR